MRIFLTLSLFLYINFSGFTHISGLEDITLQQLHDELKGNSEIPYSSSTYDSPGLFDLDEDSDFNEAFINCVYTSIDVEFRVDFIIPVSKSNLYSPNLITFGTDNSPPISCS